MYKIAFIIPWIGKLPPYFPFWLKTCEWNPTIDFLIFTDDTTPYAYPQNANVHYLDFDTLRAMFQKKFPFTITLDKPYKLCDYKPTYGEVFSDYLTNYDFWGHCDVDLFWGNIRNFITDDILDQYDRVHAHGHCCLYRNTPEVNAWYRTLPHHEYQYYKDVYTTSRSCSFDEWGGHNGGGMSLICQANNIPFYNTIDFADLLVGKGYFKLNARKEYKKNRHLFFSVSPDGLFILENTNKLEEFLYVHFQKRALHIEASPDKQFYLTPPNYVTAHIPNHTHMWKEFHYEAAWFTKKVIGRINRIIKK